MNQSFEERFDEKFVKKLAPHNGDGDAWPGEEGCDYYDSLINSDDEGKVQEIKAFIRQEKELSRKEEREITEKAFGGCKNCYGKGYATTIEYAHTCKDFGDEKVHSWKLPEMRFCSCSRGKELESLIQKINQEDK